MEKHSVSRLIGAPPGYVGYDEGGQLTEAVRRRPYAVVLFDEIEKAHPDVFNVFLQIMDDGRLTDGKGRMVDFKNTILIMTSNIGSSYLQDLGERSPEQVSEAHQRVMEALRAHFKPEFLNRVDDIVIFNPLGKEQLTKIVDLRLEDLRRLLADRKISLELTAKAKELIFTEGYDPNYGARPLKRAIQRLVQDPLAMKILDGEVLHGDHVVVDVDKKEHKLTFKVAKRVGEPKVARRSDNRLVQHSLLYPVGVCVRWALPRSSLPRLPCVSQASMAGWPRGWWKRWSRSPSRCSACIGKRPGKERTCSRLRDGGW